MPWNNALLVQPGAETKFEKEMTVFNHSVFTEASCVPVTELYVLYTGMSNLRIEYCLTSRWTDHSFIHFPTHHC